MSARFYCPDLERNGKPLRLHGGEARHLSRVCRLGSGDIVEVFDGKGYATNAQIVKVDHDGVDLIAVGPALPDRSPPFPLTLASAVPKGDRFDWLVEKATELGIERLIPIVTERSVVEPGGPKLDRLRRAIIESSKQCHRSRLMILDPPMRWDQVAGTCPDSTKFISHRDGTPAPRWPSIPPGRPVILAVGPEGGFTPLEQQTAEISGWLPISLSLNTLRIETAALAGCAALYAHIKESSP